MDNKIELEEIFDCVEDGLFIIDSKGTIIGVNKMSATLTTLNKDEMLGKNMYDLLKEGIFQQDETCSIEALETQKKVVKIQRGIQGKYDILATATPFIRNGVVEKVITTERDITQIMKLESYIKENSERVNKYENELEYYRKKDVAVLNDIVAESKSMKNVINTATQVGENDVTILLQGETGVGKEVVSKIIQQSSKRKDKAFIKINCSAIPDTLLESEFFGYEKGAFTGALEKTKIGIFELANEGTLLLDEVDTIPFHLQPKLLRVLQEGVIYRIGGKEEIKVDVRVIAATNSNLKKIVNSGKFREDLYYRLNIVPIKIPPLRERKDDIFPLAEVFIEAFNKKYNMDKRLDQDVTDILIKYSWPGNVRELENVIERIVVSTKVRNIDSTQMSPLILEEDIESKELNEGLKELVQEYERDIILQYMPVYDCAKDLASSLNIDKSTLNRKIKRYNIINSYKSD